MTIIVLCDMCFIYTLSLLALLSCCVKSCVFVHFYVALVWFSMFFVISSDRVQIHNNRGSGIPVFVLHVN